MATAVDIQAFGDGYRRHALLLMHEHASAVVVEVWCEGTVIDTIERNGDWPRLAPETMAAP